MEIQYTANVETPATPTTVIAPPTSQGINQGLNQLTPTQVDSQISVIPSQPAPDVVVVTPTPSTPQDFKVVIND